MATVYDPPVTWYMTNTYYPTRVTPVEVHRETAKTIEVGTEQVWYGGRGTRIVRKDSTTCRFFPTEVAAWQSLADRAQRRVSALGEELERAQQAVATAQEALARVGAVTYAGGDASGGTDA
jgi:hypothetical protein